MYELVKEWPRLPKGYVLGNPTGISIDSQQNIVVFSRAGRPWMDPMPDDCIAEKTILVLDRESGEIINSWGDHLFILPHGLTIDAHNNVWVTDVGQHQIFKFSYKAELLMTLGEANVPGKDKTHFNLPTDIAVAADGSFYVSDGYSNSRIVKFSANGDYLFEWGEKGSQPGQFDLPHGIELDANGNVFVADRENNRVQVFTAGGKYLDEWSSKSFGKMYSLAFDKTSGQLIAVDHMVDEKGPLGSDIIVFDTAKKQSTQFGRSSSFYNGPVCEYHGVTIDNDGNIYVGDILGNTIHKFKKTASERF